MSSGQSASLPSISLLLGQSTESVGKVASQLENISNYCDSRTHHVIKKYLLENSSVDKKISLQKCKELNTQIKKVSHLVMEQILFRLEAGTQVHFSQLSGKSITYGTHFMRFSRITNEIAYGTVGTTGDERRATILTKSVPLKRFDTVQTGIPNSFDRDHILKNLSIASQQDVTEDFSFTLHTEGAKKENPGEFEQLVLSFSNEADYSAWLDALQMKISDTLSLSAFNFSSYSLYQIYALLAINHGISKIERELITFQPEVPPLPPGPDSYKVVDTSKCVHPSRKPTIRARRNTTWIEDINYSSSKDDVEDDFDFDLDSIVDAKLSQLTEEQTTIEPPSPRTATFSDISASTNSSKVSPHRTSSSPKTLERAQSASSWKRAGDLSKSRGTRKANMLQRNPSKQLEPPRG